MAGKSPVSTVIRSRTEMNATSQAHSGPRLRTTVGLTAVLMVVACASTPPPTASLQAAHQAISNAERAEAGHYAPAQLGEARSKLASADTAVSEQKMTMAEQFADESRVEAQLASAKTADLKAKAVNDETTRSTGTLIEELHRKAGDLIEQMQPKSGDKP
jgi:phage-related tail protein